MTRDRQFFVTPALAATVVLNSQLDPFMGGRPLVAAVASGGRFQLHLLPEDTGTGGIVAWTSTTPHPLCAVSAGLVDGVHLYPSDLQSNDTVGEVGTAVFFHTDDPRLSLTPGDNCLLAGYVADNYWALRPYDENEFGMDRGDFLIDHVGASVSLRRYGQMRPGAERMVVNRGSRPMLVYDRSVEVDENVLTELQPGQAMRWRCVVDSEIDEGEPWWAPSSYPLRVATVYLMTHFLRDLMESSAPPVPPPPSKRKRR